MKCFKYGRKGHIAPNYRVKEIIANLGIGKSLKQQMVNLIKSDSESSKQTSREKFSEDQLLLVEEDWSNESNEFSS